MTLLTYRNFHGQKEKLVEINGQIYECLLVKIIEVKYHHDEKLIEIGTEGSGTQYCSVKEEQINELDKFFDVDFIDRIVGKITYNLIEYGRIYRGGKIKGFLQTDLKWLEKFDKDRPDCILFD